MRYQVPQNHNDCHCTMCPAVLTHDESSDGWIVSTRDYGSDGIYGHVRALTCPTHSEPDVDRALSESLRIRGY